MKKIFIIVSLIACLLVFSSGCGCTNPRQAEPVITLPVNLFFANSYGEMATEMREIANIPDHEQFLKLVIEELIKGPESESLIATIPETVKVHALTIETDLVHVDFSREMHTDHWRGADSEVMTINSIVNTLTEFPFVERIKMTVAGEAMNIEHMFLDEPIRRYEIY